MKKLVFFLVWIALTIPVLAQGSGAPSVPPITVQEADGSPRVQMPTKIIFPNGSLSVTGKQVTVTFSGGDVSIGNGANFYWQSRSVISSPADGTIRFTNAATTDFDRLQFGGTSASFPALKRSGPALQVKLADDSAFASIRVDSFQVVNSSNQVKMEANNPSKGYYNTSDISFNWSNSTSSNATPDLSLLRGVSKVLRITDGSTNGGGLASKPDSPTQLTADQNNYTGGTGRSLFYRLSSDASRTITGFNPAGGTNQDGELHYFINVGANNIVLANESASSTAANRFTNVTGADITLAANEMAMLVYDTTSARWRVAKM